MNRLNALTGTLVADAAALGLHWLYDQEHIARVESTGSLLFRQPDANIFAGVKGYFAHGGRVSGQLSHYGESAWIVGKVCKSRAYSTAAHRELFLSTFGPCGTFNGYADRPTKALIARMLNDADDVQEPSGLDDDQLPGLCPVAGVFAFGMSEQTALSAVQVISTNHEVVSSAQIVYRCLARLLTGVALKDALEETANGGSSSIHLLLQEALKIDTYQPIDVANQFGLACHVPQGLPLVWHILNHSANFEAAVSDNIRCGGDSCGRAMVLGALAGVAFGVPQSLIGRMSSSKLLA